MIKEISFNNRDNKSVTNTFKTDNRAFNNVICDLVKKLERSIRSSSYIDEDITTNYSLPYLLSRCVREAKSEQKFRVEDIRTYTKFHSTEEHLGGFNLRLNISDCDIVLRVNEWKGKIIGKLYLGGHYSGTLHCPNGAYSYILNNIFDTATNVRLAA